MAELTKADNIQPMGKIKPTDKMVMMLSLFDGTKPATSKQHYERFNLYINFQTKSGMVNFLSSFLPNFHRLLIPIYDLQKKAKMFKWTEEAEKAFNDIKKLLINLPVLKAPTPDGLFQLESDTSREGVGSTLLQKKGD